MCQFDGERLKMIRTADSPPNNNAAKTHKFEVLVIRYANGVEVAKKVGN
jgi:hypothetical protein